MGRINEPGELTAERSEQSCPDRSHIFGALRDAICRDPDDDAPRLVFADACDDERGELVVTQCAIAAGDDREALVPRETELLALHGERWFADLAPFHELVVHRGFVEHLTVAGRDLQLTDAFAREPIRHLTLEATPSGTLDPGMAKAQLLCALQRSELARLRRLDLPAGSGHGTLRLVAHTAVFAKLETLQVRDTEVSDGELDCFLRDSSLPSLTDLRFESRASFYPLRRAFARLAFPRLRRLSLCGQGLGAATLLAVASSRAFEHLESLDLSDNPALTRSAMAALLAGPRLSSLGLGRSVGRDQVSELVRSPTAARLVQLDLSDTPAESYLDLLVGAELASLRDLDLGFGRDTCKSSGPVPASFAALWDAPWLRELETLRLDGRAIGDAGLAALLSRPLPALRTLTLENCDLTVDALVPLRAAELPSLQLVDLGDNSRLPARAVTEALPPHVREVRVPRVRPRIRARGFAPVVWPIR